MATVRSMQPHETQMAEFLALVTHPRKANARELSLVVVVFFTFCATVGWHRNVVAFQLVAAAIMNKDDTILLRCSISVDNTNEVGGPPGTNIVATPWFGRPFRVDALYVVIRVNVQILKSWVVVWKPRHDTCTTE